ncbi:MAG: Proline iminopeptidase (EC [uncultured Thiotrichaceae bacterium]|uniref:Proline iminopeptidase n=1 Tax=uncultured Thiotrichaceae bacterium TaxID=298394 RepID=A0A6S6TUW7_9GAMM|nr:MAG: Proline iminopeptidase (EC [uncultured Thiotrichaceae bacterium]
MPLYPEIESPKTYSINVDSPHQLYVEECGNPDGVPVIFLHGGPGSGCNASHRRYFNPEHYRIILFDQRGCGRSTPHGCLDNNTTWHLVDDIERIRQYLEVDKWVLFAGSWGVSLALLYAQNYTKNVSGMILRGAFLASKHDLDWFFCEDGVSRLYPELWNTLSTLLPKPENPKIEETLLQSYHRCLFSDDSALNKKAAKAWSDWTDTIVTWTLTSQPSTETKEEEVAAGSHENVTDKQIRSIRLEAHYAVNQYFLKENHILNNMEAIKQIPTWLVHGRKDITCPIESSWRLHQQLTHSTLQILPNAGHLAGEPDMIEALVKATNEMIKKTP